MGDVWHAWYSEKEAASRNRNLSEGIVSSTPVYLDAADNHVAVTFVTKNKELGYDCMWDDLQYMGEVYKWVSNS